MAGISNRRSTIRASVGVAAWENHENGYLIDFLERQPIEVRSRFHESRRLSQMFQMMPAVQGHSDKQDAEDLMKFERLVTALNTRITKFWKARRHPEWPRSGIQVWIDHINRILEHRREVKALKFDVRNFQLQYRLLNTEVKCIVEETASERGIRLHSFFAQFHAGSRQKYTGTALPSIWQSAEVPSTPEPSSPSRSVSTPSLSNAWAGRAARSRGKNQAAGGMEWTRPLSSAGSTWPTLRKPSKLGALSGSLPVLGAPGLQFAEQTRVPSRGGIRRPRSDLNRQAEDCFAILGEAAERMTVPSSPLGFSNRRLMSRGRDVEGVEDVGRPFTMPWRTGGPGTRNDCSPSTQYLRACDSSWTLPKLLPCMSGHSTKFKAVGQDLTDTDLDAVAAMIKTMTILEEVNLEGNALLTERSLVPFLGMLQGEPATSSLSRLSLKGCLQHSHHAAVQATMGVVTMLVSKGDGLAGLRHLDLGGIPLGMQSHRALSKAIRRHPCLQTLSLSDTKLGDTNIALQCVGEIIGNETLENLDVGWNKFDAAVFTHLGECLEYVRFLKSLSIANCSCSVVKSREGSSATKLPSAPVSSVLFLLEHLHANKTLKFIDISMNRIDFRGALVLEDSLGNHEKIKSLDISHNPLRVLGMRSLLRLLARGDSGLNSCKAEFSSGALPSEAGVLAEKPPPSEGTGMGFTESLDGEALFCATNPGGTYRLNLQNQYHRSLLRMLYKTCERLGIGPEHAMEIFGSGYVHPTKDYDGFWPVLTKGKFVIHFNIHKATEVVMKEVGDQDFGKRLKKHLSVLRVKPGHHKLVRILAFWQHLETQTADQQLVLNALSQDFFFTYAQVKQLCRGRMMNGDIVAKLVNCIDGELPAAWMTMLLSPNVGDYISLLRKVGKFLAFDAENPTGRHKLDLSNPAEHGVAERLMLLDCWETGLARRLGRPDVSQRGNRSCIRNETYQERPLAFLPNLSTWILPEWGVLTFDYVSQKRPPADAAVLDDDTFSDIQARMPKSKLTSERQIEAMRRISSKVYVSALQLRSLLGGYRWEAERQEIVVLFFFRVADMHNEKVFRVRFPSSEEVTSLRNRLGKITCCPFIQPDQSTFRFDFSVYEERVCCNIMLNLMAKENPKNLRDPVWVHANGVIDPLASGIPFSWQKFEFMEKEGIFTCKYNSAPEHRNWAVRRANMESYGFWTPPVAEDDVMWWSDLMEAPYDVRLFLEFLVGKFRDLGKAFTAIDGPGGNGDISLKELREGIKTMKCKKFEGPDEEERIRTIFRYLDPGGEGEVSRDEWAVLDLLFLEVELSISEFAQFLTRNFGDLSMAWCYLDDDESDEISLDEWVSAAREIGFFGLAKPIFSFLDKEDNGSISEDEFQALEDYLNFSPVKKKQ